MQRNRNWLGRGLVILLSVGSILGCAFPTHDRDKLAAVRAESYALLQAHVTTQVSEIPEREWPSAIASLRPETVWVDKDGVEILVKPFFDGGYGYYVPREGREQQVSRELFKNLGQGVFWHHPH